MSLQQSIIPDFLPHSVHCPDCSKPMRIKVRKTIMFTDGLVDVIYRCDVCETETRLTGNSELSL
jgi:hypothetical protein